jgi:hypothetical protein
MAGRGVDVSACTVSPTEPTGATVILTSGRDRAMLTAMGSIGAFEVEMVPPALLARARHVHSGGYYLQGRSRDRLPPFFAMARSRGLTTSFDTNWDPTERWGGVRAILQSDMLPPDNDRGDPDRPGRRIGSGGPRHGQRRGQERWRAGRRRQARGFRRERARASICRPWCRCDASRPTIDTPGPATRSTPGFPGVEATAELAVPRARAACGAMSR